MFIKLLKLQQEIIKAEQLTKSYGKLLSGLKEKGLTILLTSHFMDEVEALCDQICILKKGKLCFTVQFPKQ